MHRPPVALPSERNVVLMMLDGVRWQEFFGTPDAALCAAPEYHGAQECMRSTEKLFAFTHAQVAPHGFVWGAPGSGTTATVANPASLSLPGYQSIFAGVATDCMDNACPRVGVETLGERLVRETGIPRDRVVTVASWEKIPFAVEHTEGATTVNAGFAPFADAAELDPASRRELDTINARQVVDRPPWGGARGDGWTMAHALRYLRDHRPRFMFLSLNDADEWGHRGEYGRYLATLRTYDDWIRRVLTAFDASGGYGRATTLIVTTDHGRGEGPRWRDHGGVEGDRPIWMVVVPPGRKSGLRVRTAAVTHVDLRPTIEAIMGLAPRVCEGCGRAVAEVVEAAR